MYERKVILPFMKTVGFLLVMKIDKIDITDQRYIKQGLFRIISLTFI